MNHHTFVTDVPGFQEYELTVLVLARGSFWIYEATVKDGTGQAVDSWRDESQSETQDAARAAARNSAGNRATAWASRN